MSKHKPKGIRKASPTAPSSPAAITPEPAKEQSHTEHKTPSPPPPRPLLLLRQLWASLSAPWRGVIAVVALLGSIASVISFIPNVMVDIGESLDPHDPFATTFTVLNNGHLSIYDVQFTCGIGEIRWGPGTVPVPDPAETRYSYESRLHYVKAVAKFIRPGQKATSLRFCPFESSGNIKHADVALIVQFRPQLWPFRQERVFRFVTAQHKDGRLIWQQQPF